MKVIILGSGGSSGVPQIGCACFTCTSNDAKNKRTRASILIQTNDANILIDTSPDLRQQLLRQGVERIDAIIYTHDHSDHTAGLDDMKVLAFHNNSTPIPTYMYRHTYESLKNRFKGIAVAIL